MDITAEFRGVDNLVYALVTNDDNIEGEKGGYKFGDVKILAPVAEITKTTATASDTKFYDNKASLTINAEGADTITTTVPALTLATLAELTGKSIDAETGAFMDGEAKQAYIALGYRLTLTDGTSRYIWRYKGSMSIPDEKSATKNGGTDSSNQQLTYTGISTIYKFKKGGSQKSLVVDERDEKADLSTFFETVTTIDTLKPKTTAL